MFYTGDWLKDPALSLCAPATRGVWMDLLCAMHELDRSGELSGMPDQLARLCRCSTVDLVHALDDLQTTGAADVTERNGKFTVICRRMKAEFDGRKSARQRQKRHRQSSREGGDTGDVTPKSRSPSSYSSSISSSEENPPAPPSSLPACLDTPEFGVAWSDWIGHRKEIRKPVTPKASAAAIKKLASLGHDRAIAAIEHSIANGWQGIFEPDERRGSRQLTIDDLTSM